MYFQQQSLLGRKRFFQKKKLGEPEFQPSPLARTVAISRDCAAT